MEVTIPLDSFEPKGQHAEYTWFRIRHEGHFGRFEEYLEKTCNGPIPEHELNDMLANRPDVYYKALGMPPEDLDMHTVEEVGEAYCAANYVEFDSARWDGVRVKVTYRRGDASGTESLGEEEIRKLYQADGCQCRSAAEFVYTWKYNV